MHAIKKSLLLALSFSFINSIGAQTSLNIYPLNGVVGVKFLADKKISLEPRLDFQFDLANGETNVFLNSELFTTVNFLREERFNMYAGLGLGGNIYNQAQSNFSTTIPIGATYYFTENKRFAVIGECGIKASIMDFVKIKSYALIGLQIRLSKTK